MKRFQAGISVNVCTAVLPRAVSAQGANTQIR
jgi:hypothetical protein